MGTKQVSHNKIRQVPKTETKELCETLWEINSEGEKVWTEEEECEDVEWQVFVEEEYEAVLNTTESVCTEDAEIPYTMCQQAEYINDQKCLECKAVATPSCRDVVKEKCGTIEVVNCKPQVAEPQCDPLGNLQPTQVYHHLEQCLFDTNGLQSGGPPVEKHPPHHIK